MCVRVWCVYVCMCDVVCVHVWCVCVCDAMCGVCIVSYDVTPILNPALPSSLSPPFLPFSRKTPIQFSRSSDHCKTMKGPCLGLVEYFSKREC